MKKAKAVLKDVRFSYYMLKILAPLVPMLVWAWVRHPVQMYRLRKACKEIFEATRG